MKTRTSRNHSVRYAPQITKSQIIITVVSLVILLGLGIWQATILNWVVFIAAPWLTPFWVTSAPFVLALALAHFLKNRTAQNVSLGVAGLIAILSIPAWVYFGYVTEKGIYNENVTLSQPKDNIPTYPEYSTRAPLDVARAQTNSNITINGTPEDTTYIPSEDRYGALVRKNNFLAGYGQIAYQQIGPNGQSINKEGKVGSQNCTFSDNARLRFGGWFGNNLKRAIIHKQWGVIIDEGDSYGYCTEDGTPMVVVPLKKFAGFPAVYEVPAGVVTYNGKTGELSIRHEIRSGDLPGPVYPVSLSKQSREATGASGSFWQYLMSSVGYADTTGDEGDPNHENAGEFTLRKKDNNGDDYVTPMVMRGRAAAIVAVGTVPSDSVVSGSLNPYTVHLLPGEGRQANSAVADKIHADYSSLDWQAGIEVFEIAPTGPQTWTATLGRSKAIMYRLTINPDSSSCLYDLKGEKLRCTNDEKADDDLNDKTGGQDITTMSDEDLINLQRQVQDEINRRLREK